MRIVLEKSEILQLLGRALGYKILEDEVDIKPDPFEVHINAVRIQDFVTSSEETPKPTEAPKVAVTRATSQTPAPLTTPDIPLEQLLAKSSALSQEAPSRKETRGVMDFVNPPFPGASGEPPGEDFSSEIK